MIDILSKISEKRKKIAIGLMSGTSLDGIDAAIIEIEGNYKSTAVKLLDFYTLEFSNAEKESILKLCNPQTSRIDDVCYMNTYLGDKMGQAALGICKKSGINIENIDYISSHGQTIYHMPHKNSTLQIGELANIAAVTGCVTVGDFRPSDMAYGGQGAPLVPYVDYILFSHQKKGRVLLNLGGIGNITVLKANGTADEVFAFDTGPANVLIDAIVKIISCDSLSYDDGGGLAMRGSINERWLLEMVEEDKYLRQLPPKSTGREYYTVDFAEGLYRKGLSLGMGDYDVLATITAFTAKTVQDQLERFVLPGCEIHEIFVSGGGAHNKLIMKLLSEYTKIEVQSINNLDFSSDAKEAIAFAILGNEFLAGQTNNIPGATGAAKKVVMGKLTLPTI